MTQGKKKEDMNKMAISGSEYWHCEPKVIEESAPRQRHRAGTFSDWWRHRAEFEQKSFLSADISSIFQNIEFFDEMNNMNY